LTRRGGFDILDNNVCCPDKFQIKTNEARPGGPTGGCKADSTSSSTATPNDKNYKYLCLLNSLIRRKLCMHHSSGQKAVFMRFVNNLASTILMAVATYEKKYSYGKLRQVVMEDRTDIQGLDRISFLYESLADVQEAVKMDCITEWGKWSLEEDVRCKGNSRCY